MVAQDLQKSSTRSDRAPHPPFIITTENRYPAAMKEYILLLIWHQNFQNNVPNVKQMK